MRNASGAGDPGIFGGPGIAEFRYLIIPSASTPQGENAPLTFELLTTYLGDRGVDINNYKEVVTFYIVE